MWNICIWKYSWLYYDYIWKYSRLYYDFIWKYSRLFHDYIWKYSWLYSYKLSSKRTSRLASSGKPKSKRMSGCVGNVARSVCTQLEASCACARLGHTAVASTGNALLSCPVAFGTPFVDACWYSCLEFMLLLAFAGSWMFLFRFAGSWIFLLGFAFPCPPNSCPLLSPSSTPGLCTWSESPSCLLLLSRFLFSL